MADKFSPPTKRAVAHKRRKKLPDKDFAFQRKRRYPINNLKSARRSLRAGEVHLSEGEYDYLRSRVIAKYPQMKFKDCKCRNQFGSKSKSKKPVPAKKGSMYYMGPKSRGSKSESSLTFGYFR